MSAVPDIPGGPAQRLAQACDAAIAGRRRPAAEAAALYRANAALEPHVQPDCHPGSGADARAAPVRQSVGRGAAGRGLPAAGSGARVKLFDVGSGGGLPGVVLAIMRAHWDVTCVDAVEKKTAFVRQMAGALGLPNLQAAHTRIEQLEPAQCDVVISRAFASLQDFAKLAGRHVREGGTLVAMKGKVPDDEIQALQQHGHWTVERIEPLVVPALDAQRCLIWMRRSQGNI